MHHFFKRYYPILILTAIGFLVYTNALFNGFVWDDKVQLIEHRELYTPRTIPNFFTIGQEDGYYRPFFLVYLTGIYTLLGDSAFFFHLVQLMLHIGNGILLYYLFRSFSARSTALLVSALFIVHPANTEAVSYISAVQEVLYVFFGLIALHLSRPTTFTPLRAGLTALLLLVALLSKETAVLFLIFIPFYRYLFVRKHVLVSIISSALSLGAYLLLRFAAAGFYFTNVSYIPIMQLSFPERLIMIPKILSYYLIRFLFPIRLAIAQQWTVSQVDFVSFYIPLIIDVLFFLGLGGFLVLARKKDILRPYAFFLTWFLLGMGVHLQIIPLDMTVAERWFYTPMIGLLGVLAVVFGAVHKKLLTVLAYATIVVIIVFSMRSIARNRDWKDALTLYQHDIQVSQDSFDLQNNLGNELYWLGRYDEAQTHLEQSVELAPTWWGNWNNLGNVYLARKEYAKAKTLYLRAIVNNENFDTAYNNLAYVMLLNNEPQGAKQLITSAIQKFPDKPRFILLLAIAENQLGNLREAERAIEFARQAYPGKLTESVYAQIKNREPVILK